MGGPTISDIPINVESPYRHVEEYKEEFIQSEDIEFCNKIERRKKYKRPWKSDEFVYLHFFRNEETGEERLKITVVDSGNWEVVKTIAFPI